MTKPMRENLKALVSPAIPELARKLLNLPAGGLCDLGFLNEVGSCFRLFEDQSVRMIRTVTGLKVTQVRAVPSLATFEEFESLEKQCRMDLRYAWTSVEAIWVGLDAFAQIYGIPLCSRDFRESAALMFVLASFGKLEAWFKWSTCYISAWCLGELELPPKDAYPGIHPSCIWQGFRKWLQKQVPRNRIGTRWAASIGYSVLQLKRSALPVPEALVKQAVAEHQQALCAEPPPISMRWVRAVQRTVREVFTGFSLKVRERPPLPSLSAHYENRRTDGGALGEVERLFLRSLRGDYLERMIEVRPGDVLEVRSILPGDEVEFLYRHVVLDEENLCRPSPVLEALKVRMITCGSELRYWVAHEVAGQIRRRIMRHPTFQLTRGVPVTEALTHMLSTLPSLYGCTRPFFCSGDYKAATDNLHQELSRVALREIFVCGGRLDASAFDADLTDHLLDYEQIGGGLSRQQNGQLMGSPLSFPLLNVINAAVTRDVLEEVHQKPLTLVASGLICNGDDILFPLPTRESYEVWKSAVSAVGLTPSAGKNYFLKDFTVINSQIHFVDYSARSAQANAWALPTMVPIDHLAMGNFRGQGRVLESKAKLLEAMGRPVTVADNVNVLLERAGQMAQRVLTQLLKVNDNFKKFKVVDWFLPRALGGLGIWPTYRSTAPDPRKLIFADYLIRDDRQFAAFTEMVQGSLGSHYRKIDEQSWFRAHGWSLGYGIWGERGAEGGGGYLRGTEGCDRILQRLRREFGGLSGGGRPIWDLQVGEPPTEPDGAEATRRLPRCLRYNTFAYEKEWKNGEEEEEQRDLSQELRTKWSKAQKESPRVRDLKGVGDWQEIEKLVWTFRYDWRPPEEQSTISHFNSGCEDVTGGGLTTHADDELPAMQTYILECS